MQDSGLKKDLLTYKICYEEKLLSCQHVMSVVEE
jgi:hypothetical protein